MAHASRDDRCSWLRGIFQQNPRGKRAALPSMVDRPPVP